MKPSRWRMPNRTPGRGGGGGENRPPSTPSSTTSNEDDNDNGTVMERVSVYCRVRPISEADEESCIRVLDVMRIRLSPPESSKALKEHEYSFKAVFAPESRQRDVFDSVGLPLVRDLLLEMKNGLLFAYGVTGSGKTHTMQGTDRDGGGIMHRAIDVIFNSIPESQIARKFTFKPDKLNGFEIRSNAEAAQEAQMEMIANMRKPKSSYNKKNTSDPDLSNRIIDDTRVNLQGTTGFVYSIFISYCEFYNNYVYDLLDTDSRDIITGKPKFVSKNLREDSYQNIYIYGATEVEVRTPVEALEVFYRGQKRRRVEQTQLNHESSRSHSVFNIRLIRAPIDKYNEVRMDVPYHVSQLALCDLAGSERTARTGNTGERLREAGNINMSLMTLRTCIEILRENQISGTRKPVPYRNAKITHLFRKYFEGTGQVKMIVCVNPRAADYDENLNVLQFAEMTQEIQIERIENIARQTPATRRGDEVFKDALKRINENEIDIDIEPVCSPIYCLGPAWPNFEMRQFDEEDVLVKIRLFLEKRIATRNTLLGDHSKKEQEFRKRLVQLDEEYTLLKEENLKIKTSWEADRQKLRDLETRLVNAEAANSSLQRKIGAYSETKNVLENELDEKELLINQQKKDQKKITKKLKEKMSQQDAINQELAKKLKEQQQAKAERIREMAKLRAVKDIVNDKIPINKTTSDPDLPTAQLQPQRSNPDIVFATPQPQGQSVPTLRSSHRFRRSRSVGGENELWVDHQQVSATPIGHDALMQPKMKKRKSVTKLSEKDLNIASKYALTTQEPGTDDDELKTKVYKGDVIPTMGGGRQVIFNDVEVLTHETPASPPRRRSSRNKRSFEEFRGVGSRIAEMEELTKRNRL